MKRMSMKDFIARNKGDIDRAIQAGLKVLFPLHDARINDRERRVWVLNDEYLCNWARREGVRI